jgi:hypothetical protein
MPLPWGADAAGLWLPDLYGEGVTSILIPVPAAPKSESNRVYFKQTFVSRGYPNP